MLKIEMKCPECSNADGFNVFLESQQAHCKECGYSDLIEMFALHTKARCQFCMSENCIAKSWRECPKPSAVVLEPVASDPDSTPGERAQALKVHHA